MKKLKIVLFGVLLLASTLSAQSDKDKYNNEPGYFEFGDLSSLLSGQKSTEVILTETMLQSIAEMTDDDPEVKNLFKNIKYLRVNSFGVTEKNNKAIDKKFKDIENLLLNESWERMITNSDKQGKVSIYVKNPSKEGIKGLVILSKRNKGEATFVNIAGKIDLKQLGEIGGKFKIPDMQKINEVTGDK